MSDLIEIRNLNYHFDDFKALNNLNLNIPKNSIFGFLGPNGAGKTTTIKLLLGLLSAPKECVFLFEKEMRNHRLEILTKTGSLVENPSIYHHLTAAENLQIFVTMLGLNKSRINEVLDIVGLQNVSNKKAGKFSTGMKQRLGIAKALLTDPELIILDEPTIGLDPNGIIDIRNLLISLKTNHGKTVVLSSHLLSEVEKVCTHVAIINKGDIHFQGSMSELNSLNKTFLRIQTDNVEKTMNFLDLSKEAYQLEEDNTFKLIFSSDNSTSTLVKNLAKNEIGIYSVEKKKDSLEDLFINIIDK